MDETRFQRDGVILGTSVKELFLIQVHLTDPTKTTKLGALYPEDAQENLKVFL